MRERRKSLSGIMLVILLLTFTVMGTVNVGTVSGEDLPVISVEPPTSTVEVGESFTVDINVTDVSNLYFWEFYMNFSSTILNAYSVVEGPFLSDVGSTSWSLNPPTIDNTAGTVLASNLLWTFPAEGASGNGTLCIITFQAKDVGSTTLHFNYTILATWDGYDYVAIEHTAEDGSATAEPGHDVAVVSVTAPAEAASNSSVPIDVTVKNEGFFTENVNVTIRRNGTPIGSKNITNLAAGTQNTTTLTWDTTGVPKGDHTLNATATISGDNDPTDNSKTTTIRIVEHDVAIIDLEVSSPVHLGDTVPINVTAKNQGSYTETLNVTISHDGTLIGFNDTVVLNSQTSTIVPFSWNTASVGLGTYNLNATATIPAIPVDDDPTDNSMTKEVTLELYHDVNVTDLEFSSPAHLGDTVLIDVTVKNEGDYAEVANVTVRYVGVHNSSIIDYEIMELTQGQSKTAYFMWSTTGVIQGNYQIKAEASISVDDDLGDNLVTDGLILRAHDVKVTSIAAPSHGYANSSVSINVTVKNEGYGFREAVNVTLEYDSVLIGFNDTIDLGMGSSITVSFTWYTTSVTLGNYNLTANATVLISEYNPAGIDDDPADNTLDDVTVFITIPGDIDGDGDVDPFDYTDFRVAFGSKGPPQVPVPDPNYNRQADFDLDGDVDPFDYTTFRVNFGRIM